MELNILLLLWVDHHDDAYRWAENRKLTINPVTGAMQMVTIEQVVEQTAGAGTTEQQAPDYAVPATAVEPVSAPLFGEFSDTELMSLGVPEELLSAVRKIGSEEALDALQSRLPAEAYEGLFLVAAGDSVNQVLQARETRVDQAIDTSDFAAALATLAAFH